MASGIVSERNRSKCTVVGSVPNLRVSVVAEESMMSHSGVANAGDITKECATTDSRISHTFGVVDKSSRSNGRVLGSLTCALISDVEKERSRIHSGVVAPVSVAPERIPAYGSVPDTGGKVEKSVLPLRRVEQGVTAVWDWDNRSPRRCKNKTGKHKDD